MEAAAAAAAVDGGGHRTAPAPAPAQRSAAGPRRARARAAAVRESIWVGGEGGGRGGFWLFLFVSLPSPSVIYLPSVVGWRGGYLADLRCAGSSSVDAPRRGGRRRGQMFVFLFSGRAGAGRGAIKLAHKQYGVLLVCIRILYSGWGRVVYPCLGPARDRAVGFIPPTPTDGDRAPESHVGDLGP